MTKPDRFYNSPPADEPYPLNRRIYAAAKRPFYYLLQFLVWLLTPWWRALPMGMFAGLAISVMAHLNDSEIMVRPLVYDAMLIGVEATLILGMIVVIYRVLSGLFR